MLDWLKTILGDYYSDDIDKKVSEEIGKAFVSRTDFNAKNEEAKTLKTQITDRDKQLDELKKVDPAALQAKIAELQTANATAQTEHEKALNAAKLGFALDARLIKEGAVSTKAVKALLDSTKISLDGENLIGIDEQLKALKESDPWAFGEQQAGSTGMQHKTPPPSEKTVVDEIKGALYGTQTT